MWVLGQRLKDERASSPRFSCSLNVRLFPSRCLLGERLSHFAYCELYRPCMTRHMLYSKLSSALSFTLIVSASLFVARVAQSEPSSSTTGSTIDSLSDTALQNREQELKRKEDELLRSMGLRSEQAEVSGSTNPTSVENTGSMNIPVSESESELNALKALGSHPALERSPTPKQASEPASPNRIRTYRSNNTAFDSTADRIDTFRRVTETSSLHSNQAFAPAKSVHVSLQQIENERRARLAPLQSTETAIIGISNARVRSGPSTSNKILLTIPKFSEITIDHRTKDWYRITTSTGLRGWIWGGALLFNADIPSSSAIRVKAVSLQQRR